MIDPKQFRLKCAGKKYEEAFGFLIAEVNEQIASLSASMEEKIQIALNHRDRQRSEHSIATRALGMLWMVRWIQLGHSRPCGDLPASVLGSWVLGKSTGYTGHETFEMCALVEPDNRLGDPGGTGCTARDVVAVTWPVSELVSIFTQSGPPVLLDPPAWAVASGRWPWKVR